MTLKYLLDENVDSIYRIQLQQQETSLIVWRVGTPGAPPIQTPDPEMLCWCEEHNFTLITNNRKSMPVHLANHLAAGRHVPGIFTLNANMSIGETLDELILVALASEIDEYRDRIAYLPLL